MIAKNKFGDMVLMANILHCLCGALGSSPCILAIFAAEALKGEAFGLLLRRNRDRYHGGRTKKLVS